MSQKPLIIFSSEQFVQSAKALRLWWLVVPLFLGLTFWGIKAVLPTEYEASAVLAPSEERTGGLAELAGGLSGLAGLAGIDIGALRLNNTQLAIQILQSRTFSYLIIEKYGLMPHLLAVEGWDEEKQQPIFDNDIYDASNQNWKGNKPPELWEGYAPLREIVSIENDRTTRVVKLAVTHVDPVFAKRLVEILVEEINDYMRASDKKKITKQIDYLTSTVSEIQQAEVQQSLLYLLQEQYKRAMLIEANKDYVYEVIDPAVVPQKPVGFSGLVWLIVGLIVGVFLMLTLNILHAYRYANTDD
ncbi:hypothetical protein [Pseudidiomarina homiensis]|uniref:hypothetical protein n=1 Tax=Pseudidiomarina homiensis TaxID=364198 RepID=UPI00215A3266|nr:hypothetical protein [Pseudidiomarina homiensis]